MARQRIHNSRSGTGAGNAGASWISYSDLMAALLLVFVLILSVSLYQYFTMLESTQAELEQQQAQLDAQQIILLDQQSQLDQQTLQLASQQVTMDNQSAMIIIMQGEIAGKQAELDDKEAELIAAQQNLAISQEELAQAYIILAQQEADLKTAQIALSAAQKELNDQKTAFSLQVGQLGSMVGVRAEIISEVSSALQRRGVSAAVDPNTGDIVIPSYMLTFETNSAELTASSKAFLDSFVPVYLDVLLSSAYSDYMGTITIEGHTDRSGTYERNMELSQERALSVLLYIRSMYANDSRMLSKLDAILVCTGKGYSDPVYNAYGYVDQDASRRVEFKFTLRDAEMIEELNRIINGY
ncbi:MAG: OmpA family protein [Clostridia bacterium]|nr:OmpA family protein [Clostridia bacterium]